MSNISIMARLRDETLAHHKRAEDRELERALVQGAVSRELYTEYLAQRLLIHRALDTGVRKVCASDSRTTGLVPEELYQEPNLIEDLRHLDRSVEQIQPTPATAELVGMIDRLAERSSVALLGVYYVFEGSKNGARYIARAICGSLRLSPQAGARYLDPHGEQQRPLWSAFKTAMDAIAWSPAEQDEMVVAAQKTFDFVGRLDDELMMEQAAAR